MREKLALVFAEWYQEISCAESFFGQSVLSEICYMAQRALDWTSSDDPDIVNVAMLEVICKRMNYPEDKFYLALQWTRRQEERKSLGLPVEPFPEELRRVKVNVAE